MLQPFLLLIATNLTLARFLDWKWSLWPVLAWLAVLRRKAVFLLTLYDSINDIKYFRTVCITPQRWHSHFGIDCCQFGPSWIFGLKIKLMAYSRLVGGTTEQRYLFPDLIWLYQWYEIIPNSLHYTLAMPQSFLLLIPTNVSLDICLIWKWTLWPVPAWLAVERSKAVFFLTLYDSMNDMRYSQSVCITHQPCHSHFLLVAANLALAGCLGWNWSLRPVLVWLAVQRSKYVSFLTLYDSINNMKYILTVCITPQPCHSHFCC